MVSPFEKNIPAQENAISPKSIHPTVFQKPEDSREDAGLQAEKAIVEALRMLGIPAELGTSYDNHDLKVDIWLQLPEIIPIGLQIKYTESAKREMDTVKKIEGKGFKEYKKPDPTSFSELGKYDGPAYQFYSVRPQKELKQLFDLSAQTGLSPAEILLDKRGPATLREIFADILKETTNFKDSASGLIIKKRVLGALERLKKK